jgi:hypothetical protein
MSPVAVGWRPGADPKRLAATIVFVFCGRRIRKHAGERDRDRDKSAADKAPAVEAEAELADSSA